jgi:hypothetical protein
MNPVIITYRTVLASSSIGAPESTAAGRTSPSSLPFITRFGTGEKALEQLAAAHVLSRIDLTMKLDQPPRCSLADYAEAGAPSHRLLRFLACLKV